jgi:hypothetical protein
MLFGITIQSKKEKHKNCVSALRKEKLAALKGGLESQQNVFKKPIQ